MRTLTDMTEEEQQACVGMWANIGGELGVIRGIEAGMVSWVDPRHPNRDGVSTLTAITPRFDLMHAWMPDGTPMVMSQEVDYRLIPAEKNGGKYGHRKWVRYVTEWQPDE